LFPSKIATNHAFFGAARRTPEYHEHMRIVLGVIAGCALAACATGGTDGHGSDGGGGGSDNPDPLTATLSIAPAASTLVIFNSVPAHATYTATLSWSDGTTRDVTADTQFGIDGTFGAFAANELTIRAAARTQVMGLYHDKTATADVTASVEIVRIDPSLPPTVTSLFDGPPDPSPGLEILYPAPTVMPRNLDDFEVHWSDGNSNNAFEVSLTTDLHRVRVYVPGGNGLTTMGPMASWASFLPAEWITTVEHASSVVFQVRGTSQNASRGVSAVSQTVQLSNEKMDGGLYYWASTSVSGATGIFRYDMHDPASPLVRPTAAEPFLTTTETGGRCVACHVLSRDGSKVAVTYGDTNGVPGPGTLVDVQSFVKTKAVPPDVASWNFGTFTPDNAQFLSVEHGVLVVRDVASHATLATMTTTPAGAWVTQPDLSPDGKQLVYVRPALSGTDLDFKVGQLYVRSYDEATRTFGPEQQLLSDGQNNFFPSWSPDGNWIAFNKSNATELSYDDNTTSAWVIKADGSQAQIALAQANQGPGLTNSAVRWAPFSQTFGTTNQQMFWLTMSSKRDFGVRLRNTGLPQRSLGGKRAQLWMTPFFPAQAAQGQDPSGPAFRLPFQDLGSSNQTAQWTEHVVSVLQ